MSLFSSIQLSSDRVSALKSVILLESLASQRWQWQGTQTVSGDRNGGGKRSWEKPGSVREPVLLWSTWMNMVWNWLGYITQALGGKRRVALCPAKHEGRAAIEPIVKITDFQIYYTPLIHEYS